MCVSNADAASALAANLCLITDDMQDCSCVTSGQSRRCRFSQSQYDGLGADEIAMADGCWSLVAFGILNAARGFFAGPDGSGVQAVVAAAARQVPGYMVPPGRRWKNWAATSTE